MGWGSRPVLPGLDGGHQGADADGHSAQVADVVDLELGVELAALLQDVPQLVGGDGVGAAAEGDQLDDLHVLLGADIAGGVVHPALEGPLVEDFPGGVTLQIAQCVLGDQDEAEGCDEVVDAVVDLRVDVVGAAAQDQDGHVVDPAQAYSMYSLPVSRTTCM